VQELDTLTYLEYNLVMPKKLEQKLMKEAKSKNLGKERTNAYVYGTLRKTGWKPNRSAKNHEKKVCMADYEKPNC
jgi:hypothetical protein